MDLLSFWELTRLVMLEVLDCLKAYAGGHHDGVPEAHHVLQSQRLWFVACQETATTPSA